MDTLDAEARTVTAGPRTISVQDYTPPQISNVTATPDTLSCAADTNGVHSAALAATATGSACGGNLELQVDGQRGQRHERQQCERNF